MAVPPCEPAVNDSAWRRGLRSPVRDLEYWYRVGRVIPWRAVFGLIESGALVMRASPRLVDRLSRVLSSSPVSIVYDSSSITGPGI